MQKNDKVKLDITAMSADGNGIGKVDSMVVFVPMTAVGDTVEAHIIKVTKSYAVGKLERILTESEDRIENDCSVFKQCGGCVYRHISYEAECEIKRRRVEDCIKRIGGIDIEVDTVLSGESSNYRNKAQYPVGEGANGALIGFYAPRSHRIIDCRKCALQPADFEKVLDVFDCFIEKTGISIYNEQTGKGTLRHIYIRKAETTGETMVCAVINANKLENSELLVEMLKQALGSNLKTVVLNINKADTNVILSNKCINIYGDGYINDTLCSVKVRLNALSFYQVNHNMAQRLYALAGEYAGEGNVLLDLYCGAGTIGLSMAKRFKKVLGVEVVAQAVEDAKYNAEINKISNAEFICSDAYKAAKELERDGLLPDVVIVDPPRKGLEKGLPLHIASKMKPKRIVYVSCDPATLARDLAAFDEAGYKTLRATAVDMFPRTSHVETVCLLEREEKA